MRRSRRSNQECSWDNLQTDLMQKCEFIERKEFTSGDVTVRAKRGHTGRLFEVMLENNYHTFCRAKQHQKKCILECMAKDALKRGIRFWKEETVEEGKKVFGRTYEIKEICLRIRRTYHRWNESKVRMNTDGCMVMESTIDDMQALLGRHKSFRAIVPDDFSIPSQKSTSNHSNDQSHEYHPTTVLPTPLKTQNTLDSHDLKALVSPNSLAFQRTDDDMFGAFPTMPPERSLLYGDGISNIQESRNNHDQKGAYTCKEFEANIPVFERNGSHFTSANGDFLPFLPLNSVMDAHHMGPPALQVQHSFYSNDSFNDEDSRKPTAKRTHSAFVDSEDMNLSKDDNCHRKLLRSSSRRRDPNSTILDPEPLPPLGTLARDQCHEEQDSSPFFQNLSKLRESMSTEQLEVYSQQLGLFDDFYRKLIHVEKENLEMKRRLKTIERVYTQQLGAGSQSTCRKSSMGGMASSSPHTTDVDHHGVGVDSYQEAIAELQKQEGDDSRMASV